jgi:AcrR family transcriptional regulator
MVFIRRLLRSALRGCPPAGRGRDFSGLVTWDPLRWWVVLCGGRYRGDYIAIVRHVNIANRCYIDLMPQKAGPNDEARERSRAALLEAGADLLVEHSRRNPFATLKLRAICTRAGYSSGAFYMHWASMGEYQDALAEHLAAEAFLDDLAAITEAGDNCGKASTLGTVQCAADQDLELLLDSPLWDAMQLLNVTWGRTKFRQRSTEGYRLLDHATGKAYGSLLEQRGREPRPPFDWDRIGIVLQGLIEGLGMRCKVDPAAVPKSSETDPGLYATAVATVLAVLTRPREDHATVEETLQALLEAKGSPTAPGASEPSIELEPAQSATWRQSEPSLPATSLGTKQIGRPRTRSTPHWNCPARAPSSTLPLSATRRPTIPQCRLAL